jgi:hypothetical protein
MNMADQESAVAHICVSSKLQLLFPGRFLFVCRFMTIAFGRSWVLVTIHSTIRHNDEGKKVGSSFHIRIGWHLQVE